MTQTVVLGQDTLTCDVLLALYVKYTVMCVSGSPKEAACRRQFPSPVVARGSSFLQLVHMVDHQFRRPAHTQRNEAGKSVLKLSGFYSN